MSRTRRLIAMWSLVSTFDHLTVSNLESVFSQVNAHADKRHDVSTLTAQCCDRLERDQMKLGQIVVPAL
jgi:hypothetical protein